MHFDKVYNDVQLVCPGKLVFKKVRLHGSHWQKGTSLFSYGCSTEIEVPSQQSAFSFHTVQTDLACEKGLAFHTENSAHTNCMYPGSWMHKSYGSRRAVEAFLQIC